MYRATLILVGRQESGPHDLLTKEYLKRLSPYIRIEVKKIVEEKFRGKEEAGRVLKKEGERIAAVLDPEAFMVVLTAEGKEFSSEKFAVDLERWTEHGSRPLQFVLGGPLGLHESIKVRADLLLSLSPMTFPHDLARVLLLEQLYRGITIQKEKTYHY